MALTHLLDTSVLTRLNHPIVRSAVEPLAATGEAARAGISDLEIGFSARKIPDLLVAAAAEEAGLTVLHYDTDFDTISAVTGQACEWVTPPGTVN
jgi:predicted nucleic acid-binding protein